MVGNKEIYCRDSFPFFPAKNQVLAPDIRVRVPAYLSKGQRLRSIGLMWGSGKANGNYLRS